MQYFQIQDSSITQIDDELAKKYIQNSIFNTRGTDLNGEKITIFDLQKNSVIPYVKFLDTPTQSGGSGLTTILALGGLVLFFITLYFVFGNKEQDVTDSPTFNPLITSPVVPVLPISLGSPNDSTQEEQEKINTQDNSPLSDTERRQYEERIHTLKLSNADISNTNNIITARYTEAQRLQAEAKEIARTYMNESIDLRIELNQCLENKRTPEQVRLEEAGRKILEICERTATSECLRLFF